MASLPPSLRDRPLVIRWLLLMWLDVTLATVAYVSAWTLRFGPEMPTFLLYARRAWLSIVLGQVIGVAVVGGYRALSASTITRFALGAVIGGVGGFVVALARFGPDGLSRAAIVAGTLLFVALGAVWRVAALRIKTSWRP